LGKGQKSPPAAKNVWGGAGSKPVMGSIASRNPIFSDLSKKLNFQRVVKKIPRQGARTQAISVEKHLKD
jgi:hypothetical protein